MPTHEEKPITRVDWLRHRGGRTESDVLTDEIGDYVEMAAGRGSTKRVYIPSLLKKVITNSTHEHENNR